MGPFARLLPYAAVALLVVAGSSYAVLTTARAPSTAAATPPPSGSLAPRAAPELSKTGRLAFWRDKRLWVSSLDGSLRRAVTQIEDLRRVSLTRWSVDGGAVAFVDSGLSLVVVRTDGARLDVDLPIGLRDQGYRIADIRWSPDASHVAATLLRPGDGRSDAFKVDLSAARPAWVRLTTLEDVFVGDWVSDSELLASTALGAVGVLSARSSNAMRLIAGAQAVSPIVGPDGRIHFLIGRIPTSRDPSVAYITANRASVWSAALDGSGMRRETTWDLNDLRLDARLPNGRYLAHRGTSNSQGTVADDLELLPTSAGVIERVRISPDGKVAYGFTPERIVRVDVAKLSVQPPVARNAAVSVFLETGGDADVWFPSTTAVARGEAKILTPSAGWASRMVFSLGSHIWQMDHIGTTLLRPAPVLRRTQVPAPRWSPTGEHVAVMEHAGTGTSSTFVLHLIPRTGDHTRLALAQGAARSFSWSPDGKEIAIVVDRRGVNGVASDAQLEVRFFDTAGKASRAAIPGNEVAWTAKGIFVLRDVAGVPQIQRVEGNAPGTLVATRDRLASDSRVGQTVLSSSMTGLDASRDGSWASIQLRTSDGSSTRAFSVLLDPDGNAREYIRAESLQHLAWSPSRPLLGYTLDIRTAGERAIVHSMERAIAAVHEGAQFAGWSPDGEWYYLSRVTGLFAQPVAGGQAVRIGPGAAPLSAAKP